MAEISVIIPVFNTEQYLDRCLDSVLGQTFEDLEVICVDDVSTDGSAALIARRAGKDSRVRYLRQEVNAGPGKARNRGIEAATGNYVYFLDSDDWIEPDFLSRMWSMAAETGRDVIINSSFVKEYDGTGKKEYGTRFGFLEEEPRAYDTATVLLLFPPVLWARLYRRSYLEDNNIRFPDLFVFRGPYYHYFQRDDSLAHLREAGYDFIKSFKALYAELRARSLPMDGIRLFYAGPLVIDSEEKFNLIRSFLLEIREQVLAHSERYIALDLHLLEAVTSSPDYGHFLASHNPNISIDFIRSRMKQSLKK